MAEYIYSALLIPEEGKYNVSFPDLKDCYTCGDNLKDALEMARDALAGYLTRQKDHHREITKATSPKDIHVPDNAIHTLIEVNPDAHTKQALPDREYRELLGSALCVFNSNNAFIIENILRNDESGARNWRKLIDDYSGNLKGHVRETISNEFGNEVELLFTELVDKRNRIVHSFQITDKDNKQRLATKEKEENGGRQYVITEEYLLEFIKKNEKLSKLLYSVRGF